MSSKKEIVAYWKTNARLLDWLGHEPVEDGCFCCGRQPCSTQRHHIVPLATDQEHAGEIEEAARAAATNRRHLREQIEELNGPENFHLLCRHCHKLAPHTNDAEVYWRWLEHQPGYVSQLLAAFGEGLKQAGATDAEVALLVKEGRHHRFGETADALDFCHAETEMTTVVSSTVCKLFLDMRRDHKNKPRTPWLPGMEPRCK